MKKILLFAVAMSFIAAISAQVRVSGIKKVEINKKAHLDPHQATAVPFQYINNEVKGSNLSKVPLGSSYNMYTVINEKNTALTANKDLNTIMFSHRQCASFSGGSGYVQASYSSNGGTSFDTTSMVVYKNDDHAGRYPSGLIYNPSGNTDINNAYAVLMGPNLAVGAAGWYGNYFVSQKFGDAGTYAEEIFVHNDTCADQTNFFMPAQYSATATQAGTFYIAGLNSVTGTQLYTSMVYPFYSGTWNATTNSVDWTISNFVPDWKTISYSGENGVASFSSPVVAFSNDGQTGYFACAGIENDNANEGFWPVVWKTTDGGTTWNKMPAYDFGAIAIFQNYIPAASSGDVVPFFTIEDATVDANGDLHLASTVAGHSSVHPDSLLFSWQYQGLNGFMFDVHTTAAGGWDAMLIDTLWAGNVLAADDPYGVGYGQRLQIGKTDDENMIVYAWMDTDIELWGTETNLFPDVKVQAYDVTGGQMFLTQSENITAGTAYEGNNYYLFASDQHWFDGSTLTAHLTTTQLGATDLDPVTHYYLNTQIFAGVNEIEAENITVKNYPNPVVDATTFEFDLEEATNVNITIYNMLGQEVYSKNYGKYNVGTHKISANLSNLNSGMYVYTIETEYAKVSSRIMVK